ncbi:hypothetical protein V5T82_15365 [Magnetovibrio sp. PR-2]|uniref:hypothetical protein n=1 Tax=Magnetovibrio sp. PR-2 TaxID=3120356 RepID=UPI002FCDF3B1
MPEKTFTLEDLGGLSFRKLNDNRYGVLFGLMDTDQIEVADEETWNRVASEANDKCLDISEWHLVTMTIKDRTHGPHVLGFSADGCYTTSAVKYIAPDRSAVVTQSNSLYRIGKPSDADEPEFSQLLFWVYTLRYWGMGVVVKDWPHVFF